MVDLVACSEKVGSILIGCSAPPITGKGVSTYSKLLAKEYIRKGYSVYYLCPRFDLSKDVGLTDVNYLMFDSENDSIEETNSILKEIGKIKNLKGIINNDVIFIQVLAKLLKVPLISVVHLSNYTIFRAAILNWQYTDYIVTISYDMYSKTSKNIKSPAKIANVLNGIDIPENPYKSSENQTLKILAGTEFSSRKGGDLMLKLLVKLKKSNLNFEFCWIGKVPTKISSKFSNDSRFTFKNHIPRDKYLLEVKKYNLYLFPSREEGCPMSLLEAMSLGLVPIVADGEGAMKQIISNSCNGFLLASDKWVNSAYELIAKYSRNITSLDDLASNAISTIQLNFSIKRVVNDLSTLMAHPTVDRELISGEQHDKIKYYEWHRLPYPLYKNNITNVMKLIKFKLGWLTGKTCDINVSQPKTNN